MDPRRRRLPPTPKRSIRARSYPPSKHPLHSAAVGGRLSEHSQSTPCGHVSAIRIKNTEHNSLPWATNNPVNAK